MPEKHVQRLPLEWISAFEAAGRHGSFTRAASELNVTQAAVSQRIRALEARLGTRLFTRQARGVSLTTEGEAWLPYVARAFETLQHGTDELFGKPLRKIGMSASASVCQLWLIPRLPALHRVADYQISLTSMTIEADYARTNADIDIRYGTGDWPDSAKAQLYKEDLTPMAAPHLLKMAKDWRTLPHIAVAGPRPGWQEWARHTGQATIPVPTYRFDSFVAANEAAKAGLGVMLGSLPLCQAALKSGALLRLSPHSLPQTAGYWMIDRGRMIKEKQWAELVQHLCAP